MMMMVRMTECAKHTPMSMRRSRIIGGHVHSEAVSLGDQLGPVATAFAVRLGSKHPGGLVETALDAEPDVGKIGGTGLTHLPERIICQLDDEGGEVHVMLLAASADRSRVFT
jgi:hypothetical protein